MELNSQLKGCKSSPMPGWHHSGKSGPSVVSLSSPWEPPLLLSLLMAV